jgi:hypothetical protein
MKKWWTDNNGPLMQKKLATRKGRTHRPAQAKKVNQTNCLNEQFGIFKHFSNFQNSWQLLTAVVGIVVILAVPLPAQAENPTEILFSESATLADQARNKGMMTVRGTEDWLFFDQELEHVAAGPFWGEQAASVSQATRPEYADPLPAILDFQAQLADIGVDLLLVPVPPKAMIYPDKISADLSSQLEPGTDIPRLDPAHQEFYALLRDKDVNVLDLTDVFLAQRLDQRGPLYCRQDTHWSGVGCVVAAREIASQVKNMPWYADIPRQSHASQWRETQISGDLWQALDDPDLERETLALRQVEVEPDESSPVILLGDSHNLVFQSGGDMHARSSGLAAQLSLDLGLAVDLIAVRGSGATPARINLFRRAQRDPDYWQTKKLVIWVFTAREFTHADGWRIVPIAP